MNRIVTIGLLALSLVLMCCKKDDPAPNNNNTTGGPPPAALVAVWVPTYATRNDTVVAVGEILFWTPSTVAARFTFNADGSYVYEELSGTNAVVYTQNGIVSVNGTNITVTPVSPPGIVLTGTWSITGNTLTLSANLLGYNVVLKLTKQ